MALMELPGDQRHAIELAFFEGLTHQEISEKISVPLGTVKTRIRLGLIKVKDMLRERGDWNGETLDNDQENSSQERV
jgi:RNA polymerase sigma-70 factor (ECF subfamily)